MIHVYGRPGCGYCTKARTYLDDRGLEYKYVDLTKSPETYQWLLSTGAKTVPQVYFWDEVMQKHTFHIGGYTEMVEYLDKHLS